MHCVAECVLWFAAGAVVRLLLLFAVAAVRGCLLFCLVFAMYNLLCGDWWRLFVDGGLVLMMVFVA